MKIVQTPSPNFSKSRYKKIGVQIHKTLGLMPSTLEWLRNPVSKASSHYLVAKDGTIYQLVQLKDRAWSSGRISGVSERAKRIILKNNGRYIKPGNFLIEIEVECLLPDTYNNAQYESIIELCDSFDFKVTPKNFLTHQDTYKYKPNLEKERTEILRRLQKVDEVKTKAENVIQMAIKLILQIKLIILNWK